MRKSIFLFVLFYWLYNICYGQNENKVDRIDLKIIKDTTSLDTSNLDPYSRLLLMNSDHKTLDVYLFSNVKNNLIFKIGKKRATVKQEKKIKRFLFEIEKSHLNKNLFIRTKSKEILRYKIEINPYKYLCIYCKKDGLRFKVIFKYTNRYYGDM